MHNSSKPQVHPENEKDTYMAKERHLHKLLGNKIHWFQKQKCRRWHDWSRCCCWTRVILRAYFLNCCGFKEHQMINLVLEICASLSVMQSMRHMTCGWISCRFFYGVLEAVLISDKLPSYMISWLQFFYNLWEWLHLGSSKFYKREIEKGVQWVWSHKQIIWGSKSVLTVVKQRVCRVAGTSVSTL